MDKVWEYITLSLAFFWNALREQKQTVRCCTAGPLGKVWTTFWIRNKIPRTTPTFIGITPISVIGQNQRLLRNKKILCRKNIEKYFYFLEMWLEVWLELISRKDRFGRTRNRSNPQFVKYYNFENRYLRIKVLIRREKELGVYTIQNYYMLYINFDDFHWLVHMIIIISEQVTFNFVE